jgi:hypothetical protein
MMIFARWNVRNARVAPALLKADHPLVEAAVDVGGPVGRILHVGGDVLGGETLVLDDAGRSRHKSLHGPDALTDGRQRPDRVVGCGLHRGDLLGSLTLPAVQRSPERPLVVAETMAFLKEQPVMLAPDPVREQPVRERKFSFAFRRMPSDPNSAAARERSSARSSVSVLDLRAVNANFIVVPGYGATFQETFLNMALIVLFIFPSIRHHIKLLCCFRK